MAVIEYDSYKQKLLAMSDTFENLQKALDIESSKHEIARLEAEAHEDGFWNDIERSQANQMRTKQLQNKVHRFEKLVSTRDDLLALIIRTPLLIEAQHHASLSSAETDGF